MKISSEISLVVSLGEKNESILTILTTKNSPCNPDIVLKLLNNQDNSEAYAGAKN